MSDNKKIINARTVEYNGITFRSDTERRIYIKLLSLGITPEYEVEKFTLVKGFTPTKAWYIDGIPQNTKKKNKITGKFTIRTDKPKSLEDWDYTPDFRIKKGDYTFYIEVKGYPNDLWAYKRKLFLKLIEQQPHTYFFEVKTIKGLLETVKLMDKLYGNP